MTGQCLCLSPHFDDAALSCGGLIRQLVLEETQVLVVTIFAGEPPLADISPFAASMHARWGDVAHPSTMRREEDRKAMDLLGADYLHLAYPDAIYRSAHGSFLYNSDEDLFGSLRPEDMGLVSQVAASVGGIGPFRDTTIYAPLAVGNHVDHQLVRDAILSLDAPPSTVVFYEDYPYVEEPGALTQTLEALGPEQWELELRELDEQCVKAKIAAIAAYQSQMTTLFDSEQVMAQRVRDYVRAVSPENRLAERYWRLKEGDKLIIGA
jgi:LmbE family N-acetylglucosaminyl deacetylase